MRLRKTFPKIQVQQHPDFTGKFLNYDFPAKSPTEEDKILAQEVIEFYSKVAPEPDATGEWSWINENRRKNLLLSLQNGDVDTLATLLANMFRNETCYGLTFTPDSPEKGDAIENQILLDLDVWAEWTEQEDMKIIEMPDVGNPFGIVMDGKVISSDTPRHDYFALKIRQLLGSVLFEIGGGYGGLFLQLAKHEVGGVHINCDLPETLVVAYYFLAKSLGKKPMLFTGGSLKEQLPESGIVLVPSTLVSDIDITADVVFNCNSLSEMGEETVGNYMKLIKKMSPQYFLHENSNIILFPDSERHIEIPASKFPLDKEIYQEVYRALCPWQGAGGRYREFLYKKII